MRRAAAALLAVACSLLASADGAAAAFPGADGRIAFVRPGRGIWTVNPDGSGVTRVSPSGVTGAGCDSDPSFSPSGLVMTFQTCDPERHATAIGTMTFAGLDRRTVAASSRAAPGPQTPTFAPDGKRLAFAAGATATTHLFAIRADGSKRRRLPADGYAPSWSKTAGLAYTVPLNRRRWCNSTQLDDIYALDHSLRHRRRLTKTYGSYGPDWSPDGRRIAYTRDFTIGSGDASDVSTTPMDCKRAVRAASRYGPEIVVARANGKHAKQLTHDGGSDPSWSPSGAFIAFERAGWVWTMRANGHGPHRLVRGIEPSWQALPPGPAAPRSWRSARGRS
jgi:Tol biopolymer transport system component